MRHFYEGTRSPRLHTALGDVSACLSTRQCHPFLGPLPAQCHPWPFPRTTLPLTTHCADSTSVQTVQKRGQSKHEGQSRRASILRHPFSFPKMDAVPTFQRCQHAPFSFLQQPHPSKQQSKNHPPGWHVCTAAAAGKRKKGTSGRIAWTSRGVHTSLRPPGRSRQPPRPWTRSRSTRSCSTCWASWRPPRSPASFGKSPGPPCWS